MTLEFIDELEKAISGVLAAVVGAGELSLEDGIAAERRAVEATWGTPDQQEGMRAFLEKRPPRFHPPHVEQNSD